MGYMSREEIKAFNPDSLLASRDAPLEHARQRIKDVGLLE